MIGFRSTLLPIIRLIPPELAHQWALVALRLPAPRFFPAHQDPFEWHGLRFRNRIGIAAGFDKNAVALRGIESLGAGFVEVGTILLKPWPGTDARPRVKRFSRMDAIWNRLGFPSTGLATIEKNLRAFPRNSRNGLLIASNIGPHPGNLKAASTIDDYLTIARDELLQLATALYPHTDFFVVNLSSPNTPGLRGLLQAEDIAGRLFEPIRLAIRQLDLSSGTSRGTPLLVKLPPEDANRVPWSAASLEPVIGPLLARNLCDGFVAVNTSTRLASEMGEDSGGISGAPLRAIALDVVQLLRRLIGSEPLIIGCGGISSPAHAAELIDAGANLVEIYSGLVYEGPGLISKCARGCSQPVAIGHGGPPT
jgi:dihydroorotate dehydrogenase